MQARGGCYAPSLAGCAREHLPGRDGRASVTEEPMPPMDGFTRPKLHQPVFSGRLRLTSQGVKPIGRDSSWPGACIEQLHDSHCGCVVFGATSERCADRLAIWSWQRVPQRYTNHLAEIGERGYVLQEVVESSLTPTRRADAREITMCVGRPEHRLAGRVRPVTPIRRFRQAVILMEGAVRPIWSKRKSYETGINRRFQRLSPVAVEVALLV